MPQVPFSFALDGTNDYGTPFVATDDAFGSTAELNGVLASVLAATQVYKTFGIYLPPTDLAYKITRLIDVDSDDTDDDVTFGIWDGAAFVALYTIVNGSKDEVDFGDGIVVPAGYIPAFHYEGAASVTISGFVEWKR